MKNPHYQQPFYTLPIFLVPILLGVLIIFGIFSFFQTAFSSTGGSYHITSDLCRLKTFTELASKYNVNYHLDQSFDMPAIKISGDKSLIKKIRQDYDTLYSKNDTPSISTSHAIPSQCHLVNVKYNVENVNTRLAQYIPNDVDYVSYAPKADKAMYCYYSLANFNATPKGSQCYFLQIKHEYGTEWLIKDDISDLENANLEWAYNNYRIDKDKQKLNYVYTFVRQWEDNPNLMYGFSLGTNFNGTRWLAGGTY